MVSIPYTAFNEYETYKDKYSELVKELAGCFSKKATGIYESCNFDVEKALEIAKAFMPYEMKNLDIEINA